MSDLKLKEGTVVEYDELTQSYHFPQIVNFKHKKIVSRAFPNLLGKNRWESAGKTILNLCKLEEYSAIDPFYTLRGDIGELIMYQYFKDNYPVNLKTWTKKEAKYDNFPKNENFGGLLDIAITGLEEGYANENYKDEDVRAVIEVKSKSLIKRYKNGKAIDNREKMKMDGYPIEEALQGEFLGHMAYVDFYIMAYIFFNEEQEETLKELVTTIDVNNYNPHEVLRELGWTYKDFIIDEVREVVRHEFIEKHMKYALNTLKSAIKSGNILKVDLSKDDRVYLDNIIMNGGKVENKKITKESDDDDGVFDDLPF